MFVRRADAGRIGRARNLMLGHYPPAVTVTAIRPVGRAQALEQLRLDPSLATISLSALAKRWGVSRSTVRNWLKAAPEPPQSPLSIALHGVPVPASRLPPAPSLPLPLTHATAAPPP